MSIQYLEEDIKKARILKCRFTLLNLRYQCQSHYHSVATFEWAALKRELERLLKYYDSGGNLNEDILIQLRDVNVVNNPIAMERLIKLIKILS